jgi:hypothetical protein
LFELLILELGEVLRHLSQRLPVGQVSGKRLDLVLVHIVKLHSVPLFIWTESRRVCAVVERILASN